jgi:hypothetical protein
MASRASSSAVLRAALCQMLQHLLGLFEFLARPAQDEADRLQFSKYSRDSAWSIVFAIESGSRVATSSHIESARHSIASASCGECIRYRVSPIENAKKQDPRPLARCSYRSAPWLHSAPLPSGKKASTSEKRPADARHRHKSSLISSRNRCKSVLFGSRSES